MRLTNILISGASGLGVLAQVPNHLNQRAACNRDNLFRCFIDQRYSSQASDFCADLAPFTATVATSIATMIRTTTLETIVTTIAVQVTEVHTTTVVTETVPSSTAVVTADAAGAVKRQVAANPPKCMTNGVTYPASRITSACSCIDVPASTISVTHVVGTETVTEINTIVTTPLATVTSWEAIPTVTTTGIYTVTVLPPGMNRLVNGDFETGDMTGWEVSPDSWKAEIYNMVTPQTWVCVVDGPVESLGSLRQVKPVYLEAGNYEVGLYAPLAPFPMATTGWEEVVVFKLVNRLRQMTITPKFAPTRQIAKSGRLVVPLQARFLVPEAMDGYYEVALAYLRRPPQVPRKANSGVDELYLKRV
ncbi:unnamed protein product [Fusarium graminearum]|nr:unnamed protein product [Fusarium graminearum]